MVIASLCLHVFHSWLSHAWPVPCVIIPRVAQDELHETYIFHPTRKHGPRSHITGLFKYYIFYCVATYVHVCKNEVIIEWYRICMEDIE